MSFNEEQIAALKAPLCREHVKEREQSGRKLSYIEGWTAIAEANRIFGFDAWDRETVECKLVTERETKIGRPPNQKDGWRVGYVAKVRVTVRSGNGLVGIVREGTGYGSGIDADLGSAHESAIKEAETDAMKRALMTFGNPFGLALYDKKMSEVEPAAAPQRRAPPAPAAQPEAPKADAAKSDHPRRQEALNDYVRIKKALEAAPTPRAVEALMKANSEALALIKEVNEPTYDLLMQWSAARSTELLAAA